MSKVEIYFHLEEWELTYHELDTLVDCEGLEHSDEIIEVGVLMRRPKQFLVKGNLYSTIEAARAALSNIKGENDE